MAILAILQVFSVKDEPVDDPIHKQQVTIKEEGRVVKCGNPWVVTRSELRHVRIW